MVPKVAPGQRALGAPDPLPQAELAGPPLLEAPLPKMGVPNTESIGVGRSRRRSPLQQAFSMEPERLTQLLAGEIESAFAYARSLKSAFTFFGGARVHEDDPFFAEGKVWGEAVTLMNFGAAFGVGRLLEAMASGRFSQEACAAAKGAIMGAAAGRHGPMAFAKALSQVGAGATPQAIALAVARLERQSLDPAAALLLAAVTTTGAGPGMMEAVPLGVLEAREKLEKLFPALADELRALTPTQGSRIKLDFEQKTSPAIEKVKQFLHFLPRRLALTEQAPGFVVFPGGFGTLNELFEVLRGGRPIALHGRTFWSPLIDQLKQSWQARGLAHPDDVANLVTTDGIGEALQHLIRRGKTQTPPAPTAERAAEMAADVVRGIHTLTQLPTAVTFIGGKRLQSADREIGTAGRLATQLSQAGVPVRIGGDGPMLDAISAGVRKIGRHQPIQALLCDQGDLDHQAVIQKADVAEIVHSFPAHKVLLYENTSAIVALPGGAGLMDEVWELACLMQCQKIPKRPLILVGKAFWQPLIDACDATMHNEHRQMIKKEDLQLFQVVDTEAEALQVLRTFPGFGAMNSAR